MTAKKLVRFVVHPSRLNFGSTELRVFQLVRILERFLGEKICCKIEPLPTKSPWQEIWALKQKPGEINVFGKSTLSRLQKKTLQILRFRGVRTCIDYVDSDLRRIQEFNADVHIAASHTSLRLMHELLANGYASPDGFKGKLFLLHHNTDERFSGIHAADLKRSSAVYLGDLENTVCSEAIAERVTFINIVRSEQLEKELRGMSEFNLHYCIRKVAEKNSGGIVAKPFTKGFIAAQVGAVVLINEAVDDAVEILGPDYPFIIPDNSEAAILSGLQKAEDCFGGPEWILAMERMNAMKSVFSHSSIAAQFGEIIEFLSD